MLKELQHPDFVKNKIQIDITKLGMRPKYNGEYIKFKLGKGAIVLDDNGKERKIIYRDKLIKPPIIIIDNIEKVEIFEKLNPLAYVFIVIYLILLVVIFYRTLGGIIGNAICGASTVVGMISIRNIFLEDLSISKMILKSIIYMLVIFIIIFVITLVLGLILGTATRILI
ncbi:MAG: hypothetical protein LBT51_00700 [Fusobacteriaceae bacterium]|jgi:hypothetical protein|nr:hypothetical protein [Fusobacteriaceae bacterium]